MIRLLRAILYYFHDHRISDEDEAKLDYRESFETQCAGCKHLLLVERDRNPNYYWLEEA